KAPTNPTSSTTRAESPHLSHGPVGTAGEGSSNAGIGYNPERHPYTLPTRLAGQLNHPLAVIIGDEHVALPTLNKAFGTPGRTHLTLEDIHKAKDTVWK